MRIFLASLLFVAALPANETWPRFRGENGDGITAAKLPTRPGQDNLRWSTPLPGPGSSSPVIWKNRLFVTSEDRSEQVTKLLCLDSHSGKPLWSRPFKVGDYHLHRFNNTAAATPAVNESHVLLAWFDGPAATAMLTAFDHEGSEKWSVKLGPFPSQHGFNLHPVIHDDAVIVSPLHMKEGYVAAFALADGKLRWKTPYAGDKTSYVTPLVRPTASGPEVVLASQANGVFALDLATGKETWSLPDTMKQRTIVSPIDVLAGSPGAPPLIAVGCKNGVYFAVRPPSQSGDEAEIAWHMEGRTPYVPTPVSNGTTVFVVSDGGTLTALDARSGKTQWSESLRANFYASPVLADGKLYALTREGELIVAEVGEGYRELSRTSLGKKPDDPATDATPALAHGRLYLRVGNQLDCYGKES